MAFIGSGDEEAVIIFCIEEETFGIIAGDEHLFWAEVNLWECAYNLAGFELKSEKDVIFI